jgi:5-methyltetrahydrofolate--homocysteine methyltransferase
VADVNKHACDTDLLDTLSKRVVMGDGAMSSQLQAADLSLDAVETKNVRLQSG